MKAAVTTGGPLEVQQVTRPTPKPNEVLCKLRYCGLNRADLIHAARPSGSSPIIPGMDWCGHVVEFGNEVRGFSVGDRVMCSGSGQGGYAQYAVTDWGRVVHVPPNLSDEQAAVSMLALQTMHDAIVVNGQMKEGDAVLIQGASSGVGLMGLQIAKQMGASVVFGSSRSPSHRERLMAYGADMAIDTGNAIWPDEVLKATKGRGVDLIVDMISGKMVDQSMKVCSTLARIINVGRLGGNNAEIDFGIHAMKRISFIGVTFRSRSLDEVRALTSKMSADLSKLIAECKFQLPIDSTFRLDEADLAQKHMRANSHFGKILLEM